jgi:hypothetical protein
LIAQGSDKALSRFGRCILDQAGEVGYALGGCKPADSAHGLLAVCGIDPRANGMRHHKSDEQNEQGLAEQAPRKKPAHSWLTTGVNM